MKYKDYIKKHEKIIMPVNETTPLINLLSIIQMLGDEVGGDFSNRVDDFCRNERELLLESEVKE